MQNGLGQNPPGWQIMLEFALAILIAGVGLAVLALTLSLADEPISKYERKSLAGADSVIVFVHGLREDGKTTWTNAN